LPRLIGVVGLHAFTAMPFGVFVTQTAEGLPLLDDMATALPLDDVDPALATGCARPAWPVSPAWSGLHAFTAMPFGVFVMQTAEGLPLLDDVATALPLDGVDPALANATLAVPAMMARLLTTSAVLRRVRDKGISFRLRRMRRVESPRRLFHHG
jgi:hypothetical protein